MERLKDYYDEDFTDAGMSEIRYSAYDDTPSKKEVRREERFEKTLVNFAEEVKERESRYLKSVDGIKQIVSDGEKNRKSHTVAMWTLAVTTIIGIAAMVVTVVITG